MLKKDIKAQLPPVAVSPPCFPLGYICQASFQNAKYSDIFKNSKSLKMTKCGILQIAYAYDQINTADS